MCNGTWVCFDCRVAVRRPTWRHVTYARPWLVGGTGAGNVRCTHCGELCRFVGPTILVPRKGDVRGWARLRATTEFIHARAVDERYRRMVRRRHDLERRVRELMARPQSPGRDQLIKRLRTTSPDD